MTCCLQIKMLQLKVMKPCIKTVAPTWMPALETFFLLKICLDKIQLDVFHSVFGFFQVQEQCQQQLQLLHANVEEVQQAQQALADRSEIASANANLDLDARVEALGQEFDDVRGVTHRLERYVEQMLRQMLGSLNAGQNTLILCF